MMDYAVNKGINFFDTAAAYGNGASEKIVGKWLCMHGAEKEAVIVATKILPPFNSAVIEKVVDESLKRLQRESIDVLYLHRWDASLQNSSSLQTINTLMAKGKIKALGASNFTAIQLSSILSQQNKNNCRPFQFVQNNHNLAVSDLSDEYRKICLQHNIQIITYSPLGAGFLTGKHASGVQAGSRFDLIPGHQDVYFNDAAYARLARLKQVAERTGYTSLRLALAWALHQPGVASVLIGGRTTAHIDQAIAALDYNDPAVFSALEET